MFDQLEYQTVVLAALLHDIGKFLQRGSFGKLDISGKHPQVSANFISAFGEYFSQVADLPLLKTLVQRHHESPQFSSELQVKTISDQHIRSLAYLVSKADNLSSAERGEHSEEGQGYKTTPLMSVLERLNHETDGHLTLRYHARALSEVASLDAIFPEQFQEYNPGELNKHLKVFGEDFAKLFRPGDKKQRPLDETNFEILISHLTSLIYQYTWCIPSNTQEKVPDVSLFDHLKTTAAIAACLYRFHFETNSLSEKGLARHSQRRFCLAVGDISGIQRYIFDIAQVAVGGGVARRLRARSLYVQLCSEVAAHIILHRLGLPMLNMIMNSGGKFYLLLPNLPQTITALEQVQQHVDDWFLAKLNGELALNLAHTVFDEEGFKAGDEAESGFGVVLRKASESLDKRKSNCFVQSLGGDGKWQEGRFLLGTSFEGRSACRSCKKFPATEGDLCVHCDRDSKTGSKIARAKYISFYSNPGSGGIPVLDYSVAVESELRDIGHDPYLVLKLNDTDLSGLTSCPAATKYLATHVAVAEKSDVPATFEDIARRSIGAELLGFLKADVDNLGKTFLFGLKREKNPIDTISRMTTTSRMLDLYFSGWVEHLTSTEFRNCYTVFSGGDDLFIVGPWNEMPRLAERIKNDLDRFTGNPKVTISAGVMPAKPNYPVARAADKAEDILKLSKKSPKNQITILGHTLPWADWQVVRQEWDSLSPLIAEEGGISSAFLYNLLRYARMWRDYTQKGDVMGLRYQPLLAYNIARNLDKRKQAKLHQWADNLLKIPTEPKPRAILNNLGLIASLLIYGRRGGKE